MKIFRVLVGAFLFICAFSSASLAGTAMRTFVAVEGNDSNPCSLASPCLTIAEALTQTAPGGEVVALDSGEYSPFTVTQSVTITAPSGVYASITVPANGQGVGASSSDAIDVNPSSNSIVTLKGLAIVGPGASTATGDGVFVLGNSAAVHVEDCEVRGFQFDILEEVPLSGQMFVKRTVLKDAQSGFVAIAPAANVLFTTTISMDHVTINNNSVNGIALISQTSVPEASSGDIDVSIRDSTISGNKMGVNMNGTVGDVDIDIERCLIADGTIGIQTVGPGCTVSISNCLIDNNTQAGFSVATPILSRGNNTFDGNGANVGSITSLPGK